MTKQAVIKEIDLPNGWSLDAADFANKVYILFSLYRESPKRD
jgi:hypothetical protein